MHPCVPQAQSDGDGGVGLAASEARAAPALWWQNSECCILSQTNRLAFSPAGWSGLNPAQVTRSVSSITTPPSACSARLQRPCTASQTEMLLWWLAEEWASLPHYLSNIHVRLRGLFQRGGNLSTVRQSEGACQLLGHSLYCLPRGLGKLQHEMVSCEPVGIS